MVRNSLSLCLSDCFSMYVFEPILRGNEQVSIVESTSREAYLCNMTIVIASSWQVICLTTDSETVPDVG